MSACLLEKALEYAQKGLAVFPLKQQDKIPATKDGFKSATKDENQIRKWWNKNPNYNIGIATGQISGGIFVIDIDEKPDAGVSGLASLDKWEDEHGKLPITATSKTGSGGFHYLFHSEKEIRNTTNLYEGVDVRGDGGYIVAPPSIHPNGQPYEWEQWGKVGITEANETVFRFLEGEKKKEEQTETKLVGSKIPKGKRVSSLFELTSSLISKGLSETSIRLAVKQENIEKCNPPLSDAELDREVFPAIQRYKNGTHPYGDQQEIHSAKELDEMELPDVQFFVEDLIPEGLTLLAAPPKMNKSWFALAAGLAIAKGERFLGKKTKQCGVLYMALEDSWGRLQRRQRKILKGSEAPENFNFVIESKSIFSGLIGQMEGHLKNYPDTKFIIIDTLQRVRENVRSNKSAYAEDYKEMTELHKFYKEHGVAILVVHHTKKSKDDDRFNNISGSQGILGSSDTSIVFDKKNREDTIIDLSITGRDIENGGDYKIEFSDYEFTMLGTREYVEKKEAESAYHNSPVRKTILKLLEVYPTSGWDGTARDLTNAILRIANAHRDGKNLGKELKAIQDLLLKKDNIIFEYSRSGSQRLYKFRYNK